MRRRRRIVTIAIAVLAAVVAAAPAAAGESERFEWRGTLPAGGAVEIKNVNGAVRVEAGSGAEVAIEAVKAGRRDDPATVRIEVVEHAGGITTCAVYPGEGNRCAPGDEGRLGARDHDVGVEFRVRVPAGAAVVAGTVNGAVEVEGVGGTVRATTVNGSIDVDAGGAVGATTVNGSIDVRLGAGAGTEDLDFETVNGSIRLQVPADLACDVDVRTQNGSISTDWDLPVEGKWSGRRLQGTVGGGGRDLRARTVNGNVEIRR